MKLLICPYFGDLPGWMDHYWANSERLRRQGYNFLLEDDEGAFRERVREKLGIECPPMANTGKIWDFRPALGFLYAEEIAGYEFWGHTDFDCVYGRVNEFYPGEELAEYDILSDHWSYICGPWTLYRNTEVVNELFLSSGEWREVMASPEPRGWPEFGFADTVKQSELRLRLLCTHAWLGQDRLVEGGEALFHDGEEISFFHFRHSKQYPVLR